MTDSPTPKDRKTQRRESPSRKERPLSRAGVRKIISQAPQKDGPGRVKAKAAEPNDRPIDLDLPPGPVRQIFSPRMRRIVDTFLMNTTPVNTAFRAFLQGPDGGYQGDLKGAALVDYEHEKCLAMAAILPDRTWYVYSTEKPALMRLLDVALVKLRPRVIEGELSVVWQALEHPLLAANPGPRTQECVHLELAPRKIPHTPEGHHRFAQLGDIPRLEEYMVEYKAEVGELPPHDWKTMIAENRILLSIMEGTVASVAQRGPTTLDRMLIAAIFTFRPFRKRGLARNLVAALARQAAGRGQSTSTIAAKDNKATLALLDSLQFNKTAEYLKAVFETEEGNESEGRENS